MTRIGTLLQELDQAGATLQAQDEQLLLRAGARPISADLVRRIRDAKPDLLRLLRSQRVHEWLAAHPSPSSPGKCAYCGANEGPEASVLPFGTEPGTHTWVHAECWPAWYRSRIENASAALGLRQA